MKSSTSDPKIVTAKNLAGNFRSGDDIHAAVLEHGDAGADRRWQYATEADLSLWEGVFFILTGQRAPSAKGYTWA